MKNLSKTINLFWWVPVGVLVIMGLVFGTSFDLDIAKALTAEGNFFSTFFTFGGSFPAFVLLGFVGPLFYMYFKEQTFKGAKILAKVAFFAAPVVAGAGYGIDILKDVMATPIALVLGIVIVVGLTCLLYLPFKHGNPKQALRDALVIGLTVGLSIVLGLLFKKIFIRPRPIAVLDDPSLYTSWLKVLGNKAPAIDEDLIDSFPSGHATLASTLLLLPLLAKYNPKTEKLTWVFFASAGVWLLLTAFARMSGGRHFLSDVSMGALIGGGLAFIFNLVFKNPVPEENA